MSDELETKSVLDTLLGDLDRARSVPVEYLGEKYIFEYKILGEEMEVIQEKWLDFDNIQKSSLKVERKIVWAMLKKANPEDYIDKKKKNFPPDLLDLLSAKIAEKEKMTAEDFQIESNEEIGETQ